MELYVFLGAIAIVVGVGYYFLNKLIAKGSAKLSNKLIRKVEDIRGGEIEGKVELLRNRYPDFSPNPKRNGSIPIGSKQRIISRTGQTDISEQALDALDRPYEEQATPLKTRRAETSRRASVPTSNVQVSREPELIPPYQQNRCCICNARLDEGHAVLFKADTGAEARICKGCHLAIYTLYKSNRREDIIKAGQFIQARKDSVDPLVAARLVHYLNSGADFLRQPEGTTR